MKLRLRLLSVATLTGMVMTTGISEGSELLSKRSHMAPPEGEQAKATRVVNQDQFAGKWKQFKGDLKQKWAEFTDDDLLFIEGRVDTLEGKIQERYGDRREEVKKWIDEWFERHGAPQDMSRS